MQEQNERVAPEELPDVSTYTIAQLKELGTARGYNTIWLKPKPKRADYVDWLTEQHQKEVEAFNRPDPWRELVRGLREQTAQIDVARAEAAATRADTEKKLTAYISAITKLREQPDKTTAMYDKLLDMYEVVIRLKDIQILLAKSPI